MQEIQQQCRRERQILCNTLTDLFQRKVLLEQQPVVKPSCAIHEIEWCYKDATKHLKYEHQLNTLDHRMHLLKRRLNVLDTILEVLNVPKSDLQTYLNTLQKSDDTCCRREIIQMRFKKNI